MLEILVVIALSMALFAYLTFEHFYHDASALTQKTYFLADVTLARVKAINLDHPVALCGSSDGERCDGRWSTGRLILDEATHQHYRYRRLDGSAKWSFRASFGQNHDLKFAPTGFTLGQQGRFSYCPFSKSQPALDFVVSQSGKIRVEIEEQRICASSY